MRRRTYLAAAAATATATAGCTDGGGSDSEATAAAADDPPPLADPDEDGTLDAFADLDAWTVVAGSASLVEGDGAVGDAAVRLAADADDEEVRLIRELPEPIDLSGASPGLAVATEETVTPLIQLFDDDGNVVDFRTTVRAGDELRRCNFGVAGVDAGADLSAVSRIHLGFFAGDGERELLLDDLHRVPRPDDGLICLQFDRGHESIREEALPVLEERGFPATAFVPTDLIRAESGHDGDRMTEDQLADLDDAGWTIASYTANGGLLTDLEPDEQADQLEEAREWLEDEGYDDGARYVSYPGGRYDATSLEAAAETYDLGFAGRHPVQGQVVDPARYPRVVDPDVEVAEAILDRTAELGGITTLCYYGLEADDAADRFAETVERLAERVDAGDLEIVTPSEIESEYVFDAD